MKYLIKAPVGSGKPVFTKEFDSHEEMEHWLLEKNNEVWKASPRNEKINFPVKEIL
ncbi:hypothetical protein [Levilactobacillus humaensis]|uniref:hypothetical protein n=1 Tax=Levilactobacillus humaensis TaxID=2950375 RepID=UPI0021C4758F|nr:hypothetical protein [Levilactobacillus humaensis]